MKSLTFRSDYARSPRGLDELARLIKDVFEVDVAPLDRLGHDPGVVAFGYWNGDNLVANVSLYARRLWLQGEEVKAFGVQSVAVRPEWRGKGLFRDLMRRAITFADERVDLITLGTATPDLYRQFGFRQIMETVFGAHVPPTPIRSNYRVLSLERDADVACLKDGFSRRTPTSLFASACDHPALFMLKAIQTLEIELLHLPELDAIVAVEGRPDGGLLLLDIVAPTIPSLDAITSALGYCGSWIDVHLTPDRLAWLPADKSEVDNGNMVRGPFAPEGQAFMLSTMVI